MPGALIPLRMPDRHGFSTTFLEIKSDLLATKLPCKAANFSLFVRHSTISFSERRISAIIKSYWMHQRL